MTQPLLEVSNVTLGIGTLIIILIIVAKLDRCQYWLSVGAVPSETVSSLLKKSGVEHKSLRLPKPGKETPGVHASIHSHSSMPESTEGRSRAWREAEHHNHNSVRL